MSGETKVRYKVVRVADNTDDQQSSSAIENALSTSVTQEDLQTFILSQIKRIIHGDNPGVWRDAIGASSGNVLSLEELTQSLDVDGFKIPATCLASDSVGNIVHISGDSVGGVVQVESVDITSFSKMPGVGAIVSKSSPTSCVILRYGVLNIPGLVPGKTYFTGSNSRPTGIRPTAPVGGSAFIQVVGVAMDSSRLMLNPAFNLTKVFS